jgi:hypothetical protein
LLLRQKAQSTSEQQRSLERKQAAFVVLLRSRMERIERALPWYSLSLGTAPRDREAGSFTAAVYQNNDSGPCTAPRNRYLKQLVLFHTFSTKIPQAFQKPSLTVSSCICHSRSAPLCTMILNIALLLNLATKNDLQAPADVRMQNYRHRSARNLARTSLAVVWCG